MLLNLTLNRMKLINRHAYLCDNLQHNFDGFRIIIISINCNRFYKVVIGPFCINSF